MRTMKNTIWMLATCLAMFLFGQSSQAQVFFIGVNGGASYSWFNSPKIDNTYTSDGWGWNMGFFLRYGKRPYYQVGFDWTRCKNTIDLIEGDEPQRKEDIPFHNFDFSLKVGYEIIQKPMFKLKAHAGPFIGRSQLLSTEDYVIDQEEFRNPQYGVISGIGFQFTNLVVDFEYSYHFNDLFKPFYEDGQRYEAGSNLQLFTIKAGLMF